MEKKDRFLADWAKQELVNFVGQIDKRLSFLWQEEIEKGFGFSKKEKELTKEILIHACEHNLRTSKRLRSALVYYAFKLGALKDEEIWKVCESVELVHTALLMHDDFMDRDKVRRGKPTTQEYFGNGDEHFGNSMAVCVGDTVLCLGFERFLETKMESKKVILALKQLMRGIANTAFGQAFDANLEKLQEICEEDVLALQISKTGIYTYENPLLAGAILANLSSEVLEILKDYSKFAGIAFQMQDDILGVFGDEERTGKSSDSDIRQGKRTMIYLKTVEKLENEDKAKFLELWGRDDLSENEISWIKIQIESTGARSDAFVMAKEYAQKAVMVAKNLRDKGLDKEAVDFLEGIAAYMVERDI